MNKECLHFYGKSFHNKEKMFLEIVTNTLKFSLTSYNSD